MCIVQGNKQENATHKCTHLLEKIHSLHTEKGSQLLLGLENVLQDIGLHRVFTIQSPVVSKDSSQLCLSEIVFQSHMPGVFTGQDRESVNK